MALMLIPLILLYELGILLSRMAAQTPPEAGSSWTLVSEPSEIEG